MTIVGALAVGANQKREDSGQKHEDQRLHNANQQFHEIERNGNHGRQDGHELGHRLQHILTRKDIAVETEGE